MQNIPAGTTATFAPDYISPDSLGDGWVVILEKPDGTDDHAVALAGGGNGPPQWAVYTQDSPNLKIYVPASALAGTYRVAAAQVINGSRSGQMYNALFTVSAAPVPPPPPPPPPSNLLPAGSTRMFILNGFDEPSQIYSAPGSEEPWEVIFTDPVSHVVSIMGTSQKPNGWAVSRVGIKVYVHCPPGTVVSKGYEARLEVTAFF